MITYRTRTIRGEEYRLNPVYDRADRALSRMQLMVVRVSGEDRIDETLRRTGQCILATVELLDELLWTSDRGDLLDVVTVAVTGINSTAINGLRAVHVGAVTQTETPMSRAVAALSELQQAALDYLLGGGVVKLQTVVRPWFNETPGRGSANLDPGDDLSASVYAYRTEATDAERAVEEAYAHFNADDRPNGRTERSVCVADVMKVAGASGSSWWVIGFAGARKLSADEVAVLNLEADPSEAILAEDIWNAASPLSIQGAERLTTFEGLRAQNTCMFTVPCVPARHESGFLVVRTLDGERQAFKVSVERIG